MTRPMPPAGQRGFVPAPEVMEWVLLTFLNPDSDLYNPDHEHLEHLKYPDLAFLWAPKPFEKGARQVIGQCEKVMFQSGGWKRERQEEQMEEWFGDVPKFLITLAGRYCEECTDLEFCALVEHELYHIGQAKDAFGMPAFSSETGLPLLRLHGHDVEEFHGVVRRYGGDEAVNKMVELANAKPEIGAASIAQACGNCLLRVA